MPSDFFWPCIRKMLYQNLSDQISSNKIVYDIIGPCIIGLSHARYNKNTALCHPSRSQSTQLSQQRCYCTEIITRRARCEFSDWLTCVPKTSVSCIASSNWRRRIQSEYTLILVLVVFARCIIKTWMVPVQSHKLLTFLSSQLVWDHIYIWHVETYQHVDIHTKT